MARKVEVTHVDDMDGSPDAKTVSFGFNNRWYEIDLAPENAEKFKEVLKPYLRKARATAPPKTQPNESKEIRKWAKNNGYELAEKGRIHRHIVEAYRSAS